LLHHRIRNDWFSLAYEIEASTGKTAEQAARQLKESLIAANELFKIQAFLLSDELTLVDCMLGPLMWRLALYGVKLGKPGASIENYAQRIFSRASFKTSLTMAERELVLGVS
jgi:RNA polymerase-associated protein